MRGRSANACARGCGVCSRSARSLRHRCIAAATSTSSARGRRSRREPEDWPSVQLSPDGRWLAVSVSRGWTRTDVYLEDRSRGGFTTVIEGVDAVFGVTLRNMLRYQRFRIARFWIPEYGSPGDPAAFHWLHAYSPYHRVLDGVPYPAVLLTAGESDSRVDPMHARKMAARLQAASSSRRPVLLRVEARAGHGQGKPLSKLLEEWTDVWAFLFGELGMEAWP
jgi:hypothetical protein